MEGRGSSLCSCGRALLREAEALCQIGEAGIRSERIEDLLEPRPEEPGRSLLLRTPEEVERAIVVAEQRVDRGYVVEVHARGCGALELGGGGERVGAPALKRGDASQLRAQRRAVRVQLQAALRRPHRS